MLFLDLLVFFLGIVVMADAQTCFSPNGTIKSQDTPCHSAFTGDGASACCNHADICLNNGLCLSQNGGEYIYRGTCTDESWQSPECSQYCTDGKSINQCSGNLFKREFRCGLILTLILLFQSIRVVERPYISFITSRTNRCSAVARALQTTTHAWTRLKGAPHRFLLRLGS